MFFILLLLIITSVNFFFTRFPAHNHASQVEQFFKQGLDTTVTKLVLIEAAINSNRSNKFIQQSFLQARAVYKQIEFLLEYYYPYLGRSVNGPALPFADGENSLSVLPPQGFQVMEEIVFPEYDVKDSAELSEQVALLKQIFLNIRDQKDPYGFQDKYIWDAIRFEIYRLISLGISGFDSQSAANSIPEASAVISSLKHVVNFYAEDIKDLTLLHQLGNNLDSAIKYLNAHKSFNDFDRLAFIREYANPLSEKLTRCTEKLGYNLPGERRLISPLAPNMFAYSFYDPSVYSPNEEANATPDKILLGKKLFFDNILSENKERSCATCHQPLKAFTDGLAKSLTLNDTDVLPRNAPTLLNAAFQPRQFFDSRAVFMEQQVFEVVHNPKEMGGSLASAVKRIQQDSSYASSFAKAYAYAAPAVSEANITNAIAAYLRSLISLNSRFDAYVHGKNNALNKDEIKGFNLFMGKAKCGTCHFIPFFNGVAPPYFSESESEVIGVPSTNDTLHPALDPDEGKYNLYPIDILRFAFKTPTLRNIALTAPYMHNGVYRSLDEVLDFYNNGGGAGLGIAPGNQTLPAEPLQLSATEKKQIIAFLHALTDTSLATARHQ